jgi:hypothetical protein
MDPESRYSSTNIDFFCSSDAKVLVFQIRISIFSSTSKKYKINHDFCRLLNNILSLKTDVNAPTVISKKKPGKNTYLLLASWKLLKK